MLHPENILHKESLLSEMEYQTIGDAQKGKLFSIHWELRVMLYLGVMLLSTGLGIFVYLNIDTIGHQAILAFIALCSAGCFFYCYKHRSPFSWEQVTSPTPVFDYLLLLGTLLFLTFEGYLQFQYNVFGTQYGLATFIPMIVLFSLAYFFDHRGLLSLGITALAAWLGLTVTPLDILSGNDFSFDTLRLTGLLLGFALAAVTAISETKDLKKHFAFTYLNFASQILFISTLSGLFDSEFWFLYALLLACLTTAFIWYARKEQSFFFLLSAAIYGYIGLSYLIVEALIKIPDDNGIFLIGYYFIGSCGAIVYFFFHYKKFLGKKAKPETHNI